MIRIPWKGIFVLLAILAPLAAGGGFAQESNGLPDGLYAVPDSGGSAGGVQDSTSNRAVESYLNSLDSQGDRFKRDLEKAEAAQQAVASAKRQRDLAAHGGDSDWSSGRTQLAEQAWVAIFVAAGLLLSLAVGGYVWWSRRAYALANRAVFLAMESEPGPKPAGAEKQDKPSQRRAA